jgi:hypothetical protein
VLPETYSWTTIDITQALRGDSVAGLTAPYCHIVTPFQTSFRGLASYIVPKIDVQLSATWRSDPGVELMANYVVSNAIANSGPQPLGRNLSSGNVTVNLVPRGTLYGDRINDIDFRVMKVLHFGRTRLQAGVDIYNVMNADTVTLYNLTFNPAVTTGSAAWLSPQAIATARYAKINVQLDF